MAAVSSNIGNNANRPKDRLCTENLFVPQFVVRSTFIKNLLTPLYRFRYYILRTFFRHFPGRPLPFVGEISILYILVMIGFIMLIIALLFTIRSGSTSSGQNCQVVGLIVIVLALRNNINTVLFGLSFERAIHFHKFSGFIFIISTAIHGYYSSVGQSPSAFLSGGTSNWTGVVLGVLVGGIALSYALKNLNFELFYYSHMTMYIVSIPIAYLHSSPIYALSCFVWAADLLIRYCLKRTSAVAVLELLPADVIRITIPKHFEYSPGQYCFIMIPQLSFFEYHPFSISTAPFDKNVKFHVRALGNWTNSLKSLLLENLKHSSNRESDLSLSQSDLSSLNQTSVGTQAVEVLSRLVLPINIEGPFGIPSVDLLGPQYEVLLFISAGIGVTPCQSVFNHIIHQYAFNNRKLRKVIFIWSVRDKAMIDSVTKSHENARKANLRTNNNNLDGENGKINPINELPISFQPNLLNFSNKMAYITEDAIRAHVESGQGLNDQKFHASKSSNPLNKSHSFKNTERASKSESAGLESPIFDDGAAANSEQSDLRPVSFDFDDVDDNNDSGADKVFKVEFFLTQVRAQDKQEAAKIFPDVQGSYLTFGRPDFTKIFKEVCDVCSHGSNKTYNNNYIDRVAVMTCGPQSVIDDVYYISKKDHFTTDTEGRQAKVTFDVHSEVFDF